MTDEHIKNAFRSGTDYTYEGDGVEVNAVPNGDGTAVIGHFQVPESSRGTGLGSRVIAALLDVLREDEMTAVMARIAVTDEPTLDDSTVQFLKKHGFSNFRFEDDGDWGWVVHARRPLNP